MIGVGAVGSVGGHSRRRALPSGAPDFTLSNATVTTAWGLVTVGELTPTGAPADAYFVLVEGAGATGDEADIAVVNG